MLLIERDGGRRKDVVGHLFVSICLQAGITLVRGSDGHDGHICGHAEDIG